ncbi:hypothetical protein JMUB7531_28840 [Staphylococcus aureus]
MSRGLGDVYKRQALRPNAKLTGPSAGHGGTDAVSYTHLTLPTTERV